MRRPSSSRAGLPRRPDHRLLRIAAAAFAALSLGAFAATTGACSGQGEGDRCERKNGDNDCAEGLVCKSAKDLGGNADICCPASGSTNPECNPGAVTTSSTGTGTSSSTGDTTSSGSTSSGTTSATTSSGSTTASSSSGGTGGAGGMAGSTGTM